MYHDLLRAVVLSQLQHNSIVANFTVLQASDVAAMIQLIENQYIILCLESLSNSYNCFKIV
jgi:hypothetical protein